VISAVFGTRTEK